jgi:hypothetical protein
MPVTRTIAADVTPRITAAPATMGPLDLDLDKTHERPVLVLDSRGKIIAQFEKPGDAAILVSPDRQTLPVAFMQRWQAWQDEERKQGELQIPPRPAA